MSIPLLSSGDIFQKLQAHAYPQKDSYFAMYSSWYGGIITDPSLMMVPVDDHLVHRGDGVFEAMKAVGTRVFLLDEHLDRLEHSSSQLGIQWPFSRERMKEVILETLAVARAPKALVRLFMSRGPGGFTTNPYEAVGTQVYCIITEFKPYAEAKYTSGVKAGKSAIPPKSEWFAKIKSCNYLQNVLMKKEAVDRGLDFTFGFCENGLLTESSTENVVIVDRDGYLVRPSLRQILRGTTMMRAMELAASLVGSAGGNSAGGGPGGGLRGIKDRDVPEADLFDAKEIMMIGTTLDVLPVAEYEGRKVGTGAPGPVAIALRKLLIADSGW